MTTDAFHEYHFTIYCCPRYIVWCHMRIIATNLKILPFIITDEGLINDNVNCKTTCINNAIHKKDCLTFFSWRSNASVSNFLFLYYNFVEIFFQHENKHICYNIYGCFIFNLYTFYLSSAVHNATLKKYKSWYINNTVSTKCIQNQHCREDQIQKTKCNINKNIEQMLFLQLPNYNFWTD